MLKLQTLMPKGKTETPSKEIFKDFQNLKNTGFLNTF